MDYIKEKFIESFINDNRYKYILDGLGNTMIMAICAVVIGLLLGILISVVINYNKETKKLKILSSIFRLYVYIIRGTPSVLQLLIMYYIIFGSVNVNPVFIGVIAFGINSSAYVSEIIRGGIESVDYGQMEAGRSIGMTYFQTMRYVVLPQAFRNALPSLCNEFITLIKETSIAGYVGIIDLTKASDIISSRTYDYLFPLMSVALIYLLITSLLSKGVTHLERRLDTNVKNK